MSEHETPNLMHGILRGSFANSAARLAYVVTATDLAQGRVWRQTDTLRDYVAIATGAGAGSWRLLGSGDGGAGIGGTLGATDNRVVRSDGTGGLTAQNSPVAIDDTGLMTGALVGTPSGATEIANRGYVDTTVAAGGDASAVAIIAVRAVSSGNLPAFTASGSAGSEVMTFTGSIPTHIFGVALADGDTVLVAYNDATTHLAGHFTKGTNTGNATLTRTAGRNTAAVLGNSRFLVREGRHAGRVFVQTEIASAITVGTTPIVWQLDGSPASFGFDVYDDYSGAGGTLVPAGAGTLNYNAGFCYYATGLAVGISVDDLGNTQTINGEAVCNAGTSATGNATIMGIGSFWNTPRIVGEIAFKFKIPIASDGTNTHKTIAGLVSAAGGFADVTDQLRAEFTTAGAALSVTSIVSGVAGTPVSLGTNNAAAVEYTIRFVKKFGATTFDVYFNDGNTGDILRGTTSAIPAVLMRPILWLQKSAGGVSRTVRVDWARQRYYDPKARGG
jgi:hypothetical protein